MAVCPSGAGRSRATATVPSGLPVATSSTVSRSGHGSLVNRLAPSPATRSSDPAPARAASADG